jgi:hypothetical protein
LKTVSKLPDELRLLIYSLNVINDKQQTKLEHFLAHCDIDWDFFLKRVIEQHHVVGPVYKNLAKYGNEAIPEFVLNRLQEEHRKNTYQMLAQTAELLKLLDLFQKNGVKALPFKGPVLGVQLYDDFCMRLSSDLDIVVAPEDLFQSEKMLSNAGYEKIFPELSPKQYENFLRQGTHLVFLNQKNSIRVELHWKFFREYISPLGFYDVWQNRKRVKIGEKQVWSCASDDRVILLLVHGSIHCWKRVFWLNDLFLILNDYNDLDWERLIQRIESLCIMRMALSSIVLINELFGMELPDKIYEMVGSDKKISYIVRMSVQNIVRTDEILSVSNWTLLNSRLLLAKFYFIPTICNKIKFVLNLASPRMLDFECFPLPDTFFPLYYVVKPFARLFIKFGWINPAAVERKMRDL